MAKAFYYIVAAVLLCSTTHFLTHASSSSYKRYIVLLEPPEQADTMDDGALNSWYESFLPSNLTDSGEPRMVGSFEFILHGICAWLTEAELDVMSKKPGFRRWIPDELIDPDWDLEDGTGWIDPGLE
ncbi:hypothetical protein ACQ4PT_043633 [Festuca glaucescens]